MGGLGGRQVESLRTDLADAVLREGSKSKARWNPAPGLPPSTVAPRIAKGLIAAPPVMMRAMYGSRTPASFACPSTSWESSTSLVFEEAASKFSLDVRSKAACRAKHYASSPVSECSVY